MFYSTLTFLPKKIRSSLTGKSFRWVFTRRTLPGAVLVLSLIFISAAVTAALAGPAPLKAYQPSPIHPEFPLLDQSGENVLTSGEPISTRQTCGACHDTGFIASHSYHATLGFQYSAGAGENGLRPWDRGEGFYGLWNPLTYRSLSTEDDWDQGGSGDRRLDLSLAGWIQTYGQYHVGGGPAEASTSGLPHDLLPSQPLGAENSVIDPLTGQPAVWDWNTSGVVEMNCFLCHTPHPDNQARILALQAGEFRWAGTATLVGSGVVSQEDGRYLYNPGAFTADGDVDRQAVAIQDPTNDNCGLCHGLVHTDPEVPLVAESCETSSSLWLQTGTIISPQRVDESGINLVNKASLTRTFDVHAERRLQCTDCHFSLNNPVYAQEGAGPSHLLFDPRRIELGEYLERPVHDFAGGKFTGGEAMRGCADCHNVETTHSWLPYKERHFEAVACETCHIPQVYGPAYQQVNWTVLTLNSEPLVECRGEAEQDSGSLKLIEGYSPVVLPSGPAGTAPTKLAPFNLVSAWYWIYGDPARPVRLQDLQAAWLEGDQYHPEILGALDADRNGSLDPGELALTEPEKVAAVATRLEELGLDNPRIAGEVLTYPLHHGVAEGSWATRDCQSCHESDSLLAQPLPVGSSSPGGELPAFIGGKPAGGQLYHSDSGRLFYRTSTSGAGLYVFGHDRAAWVDLLGGLIFLATVAGAAGHGTLRLLASLRRPQHAPRLKKVYMYAVYERFWHWLQTFVILGLIFTGLVIHRPDIFSIFSFRGVVVVHNVLAALLVANAALSLFYHLASGEIRQFIPRPAGFFDQAIRQALFYTRGIFRGERHPFEKTPDKKMNPLQQATYFGILNVLLPLQIVTGAMMWGVQRWPAAANRIGGLPFLSPFHTLVAWLFGAFIVAHVYLTTTGHAPLAAIEAMMAGWDEVEVYEQPQEEPVL